MVIVDDRTASVPWREVFKFKKVIAFSVILFLNFEIILYILCIFKPKHFNIGSV